jgi:DNA-binding transcriptional regulator YdaS (Cro superfamily)
MKLADYILANGLTPTAFAKKAGVQASTIFRILDGSRKAGIDVAGKIAIATSGLVTVADLRPDLSQPKRQGNGK